MSYTLRYGKTYEQWSEEKAERIYKVLKYFYDKQEPLSVKELAAYVYRERLTGIPILKWKPLDNRFLDFKPSPFIKNFINYLIEQLRAYSYLITGYVVEIRDIISVNDSVQSEKKIIKGLKAIWKQIEVKDTAKISDNKVDTVAGRTIRSAKKIIEVHDALSVTDLKPSFTSTKTYYADQMIRMPPLEFIKELCYWKDPTI